MTTILFLCTDSEGEEISGDEFLLMIVRWEFLNCDCWFVRACEVAVCCCHQEAQRQRVGHWSPEVEGSRSGFDDTQTEASARILLLIRDCEDKQPRLGGLRGEEEEEDEETQVGDPGTTDVAEDDGDEVFGVWVEEFSPADVPRLASPAPFSSSAGGAMVFSSFISSVSAL